MYLTDVYCTDCSARFDLESEASYIKICPFCASQNLSMYEQRLDYIDLLYQRVVDPIFMDTSLNFIEKGRVLDNLIEQLKCITYQHKFGPLIKVLREIERGW